jgi:hypothetical protein
MNAQRIEDGLIHKSWLGHISGDIFERLVNSDSVNSHDLPALFLPMNDIASPRKFDLTVNHFLPPQPVYRCPDIGT